VVHAVLGEDDVHLAGGEAADVGAEHDGVGCLPAEALHLGGTVCGCAEGVGLHSIGPRTVLQHLMLCERGLGLKQGTCLRALACNPPRLGDDLDVATAAVQVLLVLDGELCAYDVMSERGGVWGPGAW